MQRNLVWKGLDADTTENCAVNFTGSGIVVRSEIMGWLEGSALTSEYYIKMDRQWQVQEFEIKTFLNGSITHFRMSRDASGRWKDYHGREHPEFDGCRYIDISLTPLTNSLPVNGLYLQEGKTKQINVVYIDVQEGKVRQDRQQYTRLGRLKYRFKNDNRNFTADIDVDEEGFVTYYPQLFEII